MSSLAPQQQFWSTYIIPTREKEKKKKDNHQPSPLPLEKLQWDLPESEFRTTRVGTSRAWVRDGTTLYPFRSQWLFAFSSLRHEKGGRADQVLAPAETPLRPALKREAASKNPFTLRIIVECSIKGIKVGIIRGTVRAAKVGAESVVVV